MDAKDITVKLQFKMRPGRVTRNGYRLCRALNIKLDWKQVLRHPFQWLWLYLGILGTCITAEDD